MEIAVIKSGGKQYLVSPSDNLKIEKINAQEGDKVNLAEVLLTFDKQGKNLKIGNPVIKGVKVEAEVLEQGKDKKVVGTHYKRKTRNKKMFGHRQPFTKLKINKIS